MSVYREAERQRRRQRRDRLKRGGGKKSSLCAALSASLTALITGGKDAAPQGCASDYGDYDYNNYGGGGGGGGVPGSERVEYVTVRGCRPGRRWDDGEEECDLSPDDGTNVDNDNYGRYGTDFDDACSADGAAACAGTKGLAQMAVALGK